MINNPRKTQANAEARARALAHCSSGRCKSHVTARHLTFVRRVAKRESSRDGETLKSSVPRSCHSLCLSLCLRQCKHVSPANWPSWSRPGLVWCPVRCTLCLPGHFLSHVNHNLVELCLPCCSCSGCCCCCSCSCCCCWCRRCWRGPGRGKTLLLCGFYTFLMHSCRVSLFYYRVSRPCKNTCPINWDKLAT